VKGVTEIYVVQGLELECPLLKECVSAKQKVFDKKSGIYARNYLERRGLDNNFVS
jgi:hypothetical protein